MENHDPKSPEFLWGARQIASALNLSERQAFHLLEGGKLPAKKIGGKWAASRQKLREIFDNSATA